jgi:hypothetical protein
LKHTKCKFEAEEAEYLGLIVSHQTVKVDPTKIKGVTDWPVPKSKKELRGFLGFLNFYRCFVKDFAKIARPMNELTSEKWDFVWTDKCQNTFEQLKATLTSAPALVMPDDENPFRVETDGSGIGLGAVLTQKQGEIWHPVAFISRSLNDTERN